MSRYIILVEEKNRLRLVTLSTSQFMEGCYVKHKNFYREG